MLLPAVIFTVLVVVAGAGLGVIAHIETGHRRFAERLRAGL